MDDYVEVSAEEYKKLQEEHAFLACLMGCGLANWEHYDYAVKFFKSEQED